MNINTKLAATISSAACLLATMSAGAVSAATFNFSYNGASFLDPTDTVTGTGVLTTDDYDASTNSYLITGISGTRNGVSIDSVLPVDSTPDNNNRLYADSAEQLDEYGFSYTAGGRSYNVFNSYQYLELEIDSSGITYSGYPLFSFSATLVSVPVPESSSVLALLSISVLAGGTMIKKFYRIVE